MSLGLNALPLLLIQNPSIEWLQEPERQSLPGALRFLGGSPCSAMPLYAGLGICEAAGGASSCNGCCCGGAAASAGAPCPWA